MLLGACGISKAVFPAWCPMAKKEISWCKQVQPCIEHTVMLSHPKMCGQKGCETHRSAEINACTAMVYVSPQAWGRWESGSAASRAEGTIPLPIAPGFYQVSALHRKAQWPSQTALELMLQIVQTHSSGTKPSCMFGMAVGFPTHLARQHT